MSGVLETAVGSACAAELDDLPGAARVQRIRALTASPENRGGLAIAARAGGCADHHVSNLIADSSCASASCHAAREAGRNVSGSIPSTT